MVQVTIFFTNQPPIRKNFTDKRLAQAYVESKEHDPNYRGHAMLSYSSFSVEVTTK